jgi:hypothetical protein
MERNNEAILATDDSVWCMMDGRRGMNWMLSSGKVALVTVDDSAQAFKDVPVFTRGLLSRSRRNAP